MQRRAAIYARYSSTMQSDRSIEDQMDLCRDYVVREGFREVAAFEDRARTSETLIGRVGLASLLEAASSGEFDALIVECVDRISRDAADLHKVQKLLRFSGVEIISVSEGVQSDLHIGVRGLVGTIFMKDLREKVHRGMCGNISEGLSAGGKAYGYTSVPGKAGELQITPHEADIIRQIFQAYAEGISPRDIAHDLNARGELPPRGAKWNASTLNGNSKRGYGILRNSLYAGVLVWDRVKMMRHPETGKRISREKPQEKWKYADVPHLRIVDEALWDAVQARLAKQSQAKRSGKSTRRPARPFSGLLKCGCCGGGMAIHDRNGSAIRIRCSTAAESGSCSNTKKVRLDKIEAALFANLRGVLADPCYMRAFVEAYDEERRRLSASGQPDRKKLERQLKEASKLFETRLGLFEKGILSGEDGEALLIAAKQAVAAAKDALDALNQQEEQLHYDPASPATYASALEDVFATMLASDGQPNPKARDAVRDLIAEIVVSPAEKDGVPVEVRGRLSALISNHSKNLGGMVVAEEGLEPPTRGL